MKRDELKKLISQIRKYKLEKVFDTTNDLDLWLSGLNAKQINNFNRLEIDPSQIQFPLYLIIDNNLLNCDDYPNRIDAMAKIKNAAGCYHLLERLCSPNFLNSENYYEDMEMISKAPSARYPLWIINEDDFINSPYHKEDLKLIVETLSTRKGTDNESDWLVAEALISVAGNADSINSQYHQKDMQLIANADRKCLQWSTSISEHSLNNLAINTVSLKDKYHLENMEILAQNPVSKEFLYKLMTNPEIIKGEYYRSEIEAMASAKSVVTALAMYCYIFNPHESMVSMKMSSSNLCYNSDFDFSDSWIISREKSVKGSNNPKYLDYLKFLNEVDDKYVLYIESLISNEDFVNSPYCSYVLDSLLSIQDKDTFIDAYSFAYDSIASNNSFSKDFDIISRTENKDLRRLLRDRSFVRNKIDSEYHDYDMEYISKLDLDSIDDKIYELMRHYLFSFDGINHPEHIEILEKLLRGEFVSEDNIILRHLDYLENNPDVITTSTEDREEYILVGNVTPKERTEEKPKILSRIIRIFKK